MQIFIQSSETVFHLFCARRTSLRIILISGKLFKRDIRQFLGTDVIPDPLLHTLVIHPDDTTNGKLSGILLLIANKTQLQLKAIFIIEKNTADYYL